MSTRSRKGNGELFFIMLVSLLFAAWAIAFIYRSSFVAIDGARYFSLFDDAMISMRYAWNLANGSGLIWNSGEYVQGFTNLLMTLYMSLVLSIADKSNAVLVIQLSGIVFVLISGYIASRIADNLVAADDVYLPYLRMAVFALTVSYYPLVYWSLMGMETGLLTALLLLGIYFSLRSLSGHDPRFFLLSAFFFSLAFLTRNESLIIAAITGLFIFLAWSGNKDIRFFAYVAISVSIYFMVAIGQTLFQYFYYGDYVPNTYILKMTGMSTLERIKSGIGFVRPYLGQTLFLLLLPALDTLFDFKKIKLYMLTAAFSMVAYQIYIGGDPWAYWRIMAPAMPLLFVMYALSIKNIVEVVSRSGFYNLYFYRNPVFPKRFINYFSFLLVILVTILFCSKQFLNEISLISRPYQALSNENNVNTALALNRILEPGASIGVFWAGAIPFYSDAYAIDFLGKSDKKIALLVPDLSGAVSWNGMKSVPGHNKYDLHYSIENLLPTYVQAFKWGGQDLSELGSRAYVDVNFLGVQLYLRKDDPNVRWEKLVSSAAMQPLP